MSLHRTLLRSLHFSLSSATLPILLFYVFHCLLATDCSAQNDSTRRASRTPKAPRRIDKSDSIKIYQQKAVVVTGTRNDVDASESPVRVETISSERLKATAMTNSTDILREQTGVAVSSGVRSGVQMMGLSADYTMILLDGQPLVGRVGGVLDLSRISLGNIDRIEIVKGPMSSLYGSEALAGVINFISRKPDEGWSGKARSQYLSRGASEAQLEVLNGGDETDFSLFLNGRLTPNFSLTHAGIIRPYSGFQEATLSGRIKHRFGSGINATTSLRAYQSKSSGSFVESFVGQVAENKGSVTISDLSGNAGGEWVHGRARLSGQVQLADYRERYFFDTVQGSGGSIDDLIRQNMRSYVQYDVLWNLRNRFTFGGEFILDNISGSRYPDKPHYTTSGVFAQWEGNPTDWIGYALSVRNDNNNVYGGQFNPRFSVVYKGLDEFQLRASVGTGFKAPDFRQLYVRFTNNLSGAGYILAGTKTLGLDLLPERSLSFDINCLVKDFALSSRVLAPSLGGEVRFFRNQLRDMIEFYQAGETSDMRAIYSYRNLSNVVTEGLEANVQLGYSIDSSRSVALSLGYQFLSAYDVDVVNAIESRLIVSSFDSLGNAVYLRSSDYGGLWFRSKHSGTLRLDYTDKASEISANVRVQYIGRFGDQQLDRNGSFSIPVGGHSSTRNFPDSPREYADGYAVVNVGLSKLWQLTESTALRTSLGANNLGNVLNLISVPSLVGRQFFVAVAVEW